MEQVNDQRFDVEAQHAAEAIAIYMAVTGKGEAAYSREKSRTKWERAAIAASNMRRKHPHSAVQTLSQIGAVAACFGRDWPDVSGEPEILRRVKWAARKLQAARALPAGDPVGWIDMAAWPPIRWPAGMVRADFRPLDGMALHTAAQVLAMGRVPPGWKVAEDMHIAAVKVLHRATGVDGLPQRMVDAMLAAAKQAPATQECDTPNYCRSVLRCTAMDERRGTPSAQERQPLTDEQIAEIASTPCAVIGSYVHTFARAIEAAHGIKSTS